MTMESQWEVCHPPQHLAARLISVDSMLYNVQPQGATVNRRLCFLFYFIAVWPVPILPTPFVDKIPSQEGDIITKFYPLS